MSFHREERELNSYNLIRWNVVDGSRIPGPNFEAAWSLAFSPDGSQFVAAIHDYNILLLDAADGSYVRHFEVPRWRMSAELEHVILHQIPDTFVFDTLSPKNIPGLAVSRDTGLLSAIRR